MRYIGILILFLTFNLSFAQEKEDVVIFKLFPDLGPHCFPDKINLPSLTFLNSIGELRQKFPHHQFVNAKRNGNTTGLATVYELNLDDPQQRDKIIHYLNGLDEIVYAEPETIQQLTYTPNDPKIIDQYYLNALRVFDGWDIDKGDSTIVIAITDTGTDLDHPELINQLALNKDDTINGLDDDFDGYIDNYFGWNVASNSNNVSFENSGHGTNVAGIACARVDNQFGMSGIGFKTKFLTVRIDLPNGQLSNAYEAIVYATDQGADIINCSWGSYTRSSYAQDVVNYATSNGALIVAGAGNNGISNKFYPAAYEEVIAVGQTEFNDTIRTVSNYGHWLDLFAPGDAIITTNVIGGFGYNGGTSMASPMIAACAALVKSQNPNFTPEQIAQRLFISADNIEGLTPTNRVDQSGYGRANLYRALNETNRPSIEFTERNIDLKIKDNSFSVGDTVLISGKFINYLASTNNATATLSTASTLVEVLNPLKNLGTLNTLDTISIDNQPYLVRVKSNIDFNTEIVFFIDYSYNGFSKRQRFDFNFAQDYITLKENKLTHTFSSSGSIGFSGANSNLGEGIVFNDNNYLLFEGSFVLGNSADYVADKFRNTSSTKDADFSTLEKIRVIHPNKADVELRTSYNDHNHPQFKDISISQHNYIFRNSPNDQSLIYVYYIQNNGNTTINDLHAGILLDWDINNYLQNRIIYDASRKMGISYHIDSNLFCGIRLLTDDLNAIHYGIENTASGDGNINTSDGFSDAEKYFVISNNKASAGFNSGSGLDVIDALSTETFSLAPDSSKTISFLISVDTSLAELTVKSDSVQNTFNQLALDIIELPKPTNRSNGLSLFPNPIANQTLNALLTLENSSKLKIEVYNLKGQLIYESEKRTYSKGRHLISVPINALKTGVYFFQIIGDNLKFEDKFVVSSIKD